MSKHNQAIALDKPDLWNWSNEVLYRMCREEPKHTKLDVIAGKVRLIVGDSLPWVEREAGFRKGFYDEVIAPTLKDSAIDDWIDSLHSEARVTMENVAEVLRVHQFLADLSDFAGSSVTIPSKYLHFHLPNAYFIWDSLSDEQIRKHLEGHDVPVPKEFETPYAEFVYLCMWYRDNVLEPSLGREVTPRELDQHLTC